jgi:hypothetical protein
MTALSKPPMGAGLVDSPRASGRDGSSRPATPRDSKKAVKYVLFALLGLAFAYFLYRGPIRAWQHTVDLSTFYSASRAWLGGSNPYDSANLDSIFRQSGGAVTPALSLNPPLTFVLLAPLAVLPWGLAEASWTILNVALVVLALWLAMSLAGLKVGEARGLLFLVFAVALAPFHTSISQGQLTIPVTVLILGALWGQVHRRPLVSASCVALAITLKPQMAVLFLALLVFRGQWKTVGYAVGALSVIALVALGRMAVAGVDWLPTLTDNLAVFTQGGTGDPTGPTAYLMINLQVLLHLVIPNQSSTVLDLSTFAFVAAIGGTFLFVLRRRYDPETQLFLFAACAVLNLLVDYNRIYGATLLILPLAWAFSPGRPRRCLPEAVIVAIGTMVFLVPGAAALGTVSLPARLQSFTNSTLWQYLLLHETVALVVILLALIVAAWRGYGQVEQIAIASDAGASSVSSTAPGVVSTVSAKAMLMRCTST